RFHLQPGTPFKLRSDLASGGIMHRRLAIVTSLLFLLWASVGCSTKPAGENAEASATSHIFGSEQVTLPAGTVVTVRLASTLGSKLSANDDHFNATLARPVEVDGKVVVPAGTEALGKVVEAVPQGRFKGAAVLRLVLFFFFKQKTAY